MRKEIARLLLELENYQERKASTALLNPAHPLLIYGAGKAGKDVFRQLSKRGLFISAFLDRQGKAGLAWESVPIRQPDDAALTLDQRKSSTVVLGVFNRDAEIPAIIRGLRGLGYTHVVTFFDLYDYFGADLGNRFWLTEKSFYTTLGPVLAQGDALWADDSSRDLYRRILHFRFTNDLSVLPCPQPQFQYFPPDLPPWPSPLRFVDGGAYDGDTLDRLFASPYPVAAIAAFEPDTDNFRKLAHKMAAKQTSVQETVCLFPCGLDACTRQVRFVSGEGESSHISAAGDTLVQCVSLDEALPLFRPNLIKLDVEGAEHAALCGARHLLTAHRPGLAVCLYHRPEHLWQIPLLINGWGLGGNFYLRSHGYNGLELVMYWQPEAA